MWCRSDSAAPTWDRFLRRIFDCDNELIAFVRRLVGASTIGAFLEHVLAILWAAGANGKTTLTNALDYMLHLFRQPFTFTPSHTTWLLTNDRTRVTDDDDAIWRRLLLVPFTVTRWTSQWSGPVAIRVTRPSGRCTARPDSLFYRSPGTSNCSTPGETQGPSTLPSQGWGPRELAVDVTAA